MARAIPLLQRNEAGNNKSQAKGGGSNYTYDGPRCHWL